LLVSCQLNQLKTAPQALEGTFATASAHHMERFSWLDLAVSTNTTVRASEFKLFASVSKTHSLLQHSIFLTFEAHYSFANRDNVRQNSPALLININSPPA
jgi:hypothetical protein